MNEHLLAFLQLRGFHQHLPRRERDQGQGRGLLHGDVVGFARQCVFVHGNPLGEGADTLLGRTSVDFVPRLEASYRSADAEHHAGQVVAQCQRQCIGQDQFEFALGDLCIQHIDAAGPHLNQHVVLTYDRRGGLDEAAGLFAVPFDGKCLHGSTLVASVRRGRRAARLLPVVQALAR